ncbi:MAG: hypothetical protein L3J84_13695 [Gammaproteobacteria bacterium]|nr:hypothetical protein [Gammaproteobacteria bacterium]
MSQRDADNLVGQLHGQALQLFALDGHPIVEAVDFAHGIGCCSWLVVSVNNVVTSCRGAIAAHMLISSIGGL